VCAASVDRSRAEVSAEPGMTEVAVVVLGIIEGPDPIPQGIWEPIRDVDPSLFLNPTGGMRRDGRPDIAVDPVTRWPHVVWAYNNGTDYDVAYSRWDGAGWLPPEFLTSDTLNEVDPRIHVGGQSIYVVWWVEETNAIWLIEQSRRGVWGTPAPVGGLSGMRPSVVTWGETVLVASEADDGQGGKEILVSKRLAPDVFDTEFVSSNPEDQPLDVVLHEAQGRLWMDWKRSNTEFAYSEFAGDVWAPASTLPWTGHSWVVVEEMRRTVRSLILESP
jgi:hypothetical protein